MAVVAIVATLMASGITAGRLMRLRADYLRRATEHAKQEQNVREWLSVVADEKKFVFEEVESLIPPMLTEGETNLAALMDDAQKQEMKKFDEETKKERDNMKKLRSDLGTVEKAARLEIDYHADLKRKYRKAADHPWQAIPSYADEARYDVVQLMEMWNLAFARAHGKILDRRPPPPRLELIGDSTEQDSARRAETK